MKALTGGCFEYPQDKLLPHAKASIVSSGKLIFDIDGAIVQIINETIKIYKIKLYSYFLST